MKIKGLLLLGFLCISLVLSGQVDTEDEIKELGGDGYREGQYPGLGRAASEIFFSGKKVTFSGYAELANILSLGEERDLSSGDIELYYSFLYRVSPFIGIRISDRIFCIIELGAEYFEGAGESDFDFFPELYFDIIWKSEISFRLGMQPLNIGYINNNEEPLLFNSVNRPEAERLIIPSEWIEAGATLYGSFFNKINYSISLTNGSLAKKFHEPTWIRHGSRSHYESFNRIAVSGQINYLPLNNLTLSLSGYYNNAGRGESISIQNETQKVEAPLSLISGYLRWDYGGFSIIGLGAYGTLGETDKLYALTEIHQQTPQILGKEVYGYYIEPSYDIFNLFPKLKGKSNKDSGIFRIEDPQFPVFFRYERLDTHAGIDEAFRGEIINRSDLRIFMAGFNFKPNHNFVAKFNIRHRNNLTPSPQVSRKEELLYEFGIGIEF